MWQTEWRYLKWMIKKGRGERWDGKGAIDGEREDIEWEMKKKLLVL